MLFATIGQGALFVWMMAAGAVMGAWYVLTLMLRRFIQAGFWLTLACDLLFGAGCALIFTAALIAGNYGQLRPFALLGALLGALIFLLGLLPPLCALGRYLRRFFARIVAALARNRCLKVIFK